MTIHLGWSIVLWALAAIGAGVVLYVVIGIIFVLFFFHD